MLPRSELILALALLAGCAGAPGVKPAAPVAPKAFTAAGAPAGAGWTEAFADPALKELVARARKASPDLAVARARHREALALLRAEGAGDEPALTASAGVESSRISVANGRFPPGIPRRTDVTAVGLRASWELDFWGRQASAVRAAAEDARAAALTADQADLALTAEVARLWFAVRAAREQATCLSQEFIAREREMRILEKSVAAGILPGDPLSSARLAAAQAKVDEVLGLRRLAAAENALRALIAADPGFALPASGAPADMPAFGPGLPSDLLLRRPDLAAAAARIDAAVAREGAALADFYPSVTLGGQAGWQADPASRIGKGAAGFWSLAPSLDLPLFDAGRREAGLEAARARMDGAAAEWTRAVLNAFREVEDALADLRELGLQ
ncbi:MAG: efflux transporter outer membrane subunit, partial [Verrucomicrobiota bacterium]